MAEKNKKTKVKHQEIEQKEDLQEPQEVIDDTSVEESETVEGMVRCKSCKKDIEPYPVEQNKWRCPECNKYTRSPDMTGKDTEQLKEVKPSKDRPYEISSSRNIKFSGNELAQAEMLISSGVASNFNDLAKKAFNYLFLKEKVNKAFGIDINKMENKEKETKSDDTSEIIDKSLKQQLLQAQIDNMKSGGSQQGSDPLSTMMLMRMMENTGTGKDSKDNNFMDKMLQIQMMKNMGGGENQNVVALQKELSDMKMIQQMQQMQKAPTLQDQMVALEKIRADRDTRVKEAEMEAQKQRDQTLKIAMDSKLKDLEKSIGEAKKDSGSLGAQRIKDLKEEVKAIKEMSHEFGDKEKGAGEYISETIGKLGEKVGPALMEMAKQKQEKPAMQPQSIIPPAPQEVPEQPPE